MKKLVVTFALILTACGSGSKKEETSPAEAPAASTEAPVPEAPVTKPVTESEPEKPAVKKETPANAYAPLTEAYRAQNDEGIARAATQILSQNPQDVKALNALGLYQYRKGHFLAARYFLGRALAVSPNASEIHNNLGLVSLALNEQREGIRSFRKALELNPQDGIAAANLGSIYVQEGDFTKALTVLETAVKKGMRESRTLTNYGIALAAAGKYDSAKLAYDEALKQNSANKEALYADAELLIDRMKQYQEGLDQLNRLKFLGPAQDLRNKMNALENRAKTGIK